VTRLTPGTDVDLVELVGDVDYGAAARLELRLAESIDDGRVLVVDLTDCTFVDVQVLRVLRESYLKARLSQTAFFVVLPFSAAPELRFVMLRLAADLVPYPVVPDRASAILGLARSTRNRLVEGSMRERVLELRARVWENGSRRQRLLADRDVLILAQRQALRRVRRPALPTD
jgi:anti-anti-sigma regulatory factor